MFFQTCFHKNWADQHTFFILETCSNNICPTAQQIKFHCATCFPYQRYICIVCIISYGTFNGNVLIMGSKNKKRVYTCKEATLTSRNAFRLFNTPFAVQKFIGTEFIWDHEGSFSIGFSLGIVHFHRKLQTLIRYERLERSKCIGVFLFTVSSGYRWLPLVTKRFRSLF